MSSSLRGIAVIDGDVRIYKKPFQMDERFFSLNFVSQSGGILSLTGNAVHFSF